MSLKLTIIRRYRFDVFTASKLDKLSKYGIKESAFIRQAIAEKLERDIPKLAHEKQKGYVPF